MSALDFLRDSGLFAVSGYLELRLSGRTMKKILSGPIFGVCVLALAASVAACGGGGGGGGTTPPTGGGGSTTSPGSTATPKSSASPGSTASPSSTATPTVSASGTLAVNGVALANAPVTYTCGCNQGAALTTTNASGAYTISQTAPAAPSGSGTYQLLGHNVLVVGYATNSNTQAWTMQFVGNTPAKDLNLNASDNAAAAAALYLYYEVGYNTTITSSSDRTFDWFNYNTVSAWVTHLRSGSGLTAAESKLLSDISAAQQSGTSLFPYAPSPNWEPVSDGVNTTISADLSNVASGGTAADAALPTPCPAAGQCTGAPTP